MENTHKYQEILEAQLSSMIQELNEIAVQDKETQDWMIRTADLDHVETDENNQADAAEEADERLAILAELENQYRFIVLALSKLKLGTYGMCEISGEAIEEARLQANPLARTCTHHMENEYELPLA